MIDYEKLRERMVRDRVGELMYSDNAKYNPSNKTNFEEFLQNMPQDAIDSLHSWVFEVTANRLTAVNQQEALGRSLYCSNLEYWEKIATEEAERETPSIGELLAGDGTKFFDIYPELCDER